MAKIRAYPAIIRKSRSHSTPKQQKGLLTQQKTPQNDNLYPVCSFFGGWRAGQDDQRHHISPPGPARHRVVRYYTSLGVGIPLPPLPRPANAG